MKILIAGDYSPKFAVSEVLQAKRYSEIFEEVKPYTAKADFSIVNFESVIADEADVAIQKHGPNLRTEKNAVEALKWAGFNAVTLANNHFYDYGDSGVVKSLDAFDEYGIDYVGGGKNIEEASKTLYKTIDGSTIAIINCCEHEFTIATENQGGSNPLDPIKQYYAIEEAKRKADYVIVIVHAGHEHFQLPSLRMVKNYRFFIDAGADAVLNHHQHCYSGYEIYKEKPIFYGLGNFVFPWANCSHSWYEGYMALLDIQNGKVGFDLIPYVQCLNDTKVRIIKDDKAFYDSITKLNRTISNELLLKEAIKTYYLASEKNITQIFTPYTNRYMQAAYNRGLLPSFFKSKERIRAAYNHICCESHRDKLIQVLEQLVKL